MNDKGPPRVVYIGNIDEGTTVSQVFEAIFGGQVEQLRLKADKKCAFVTFLHSNGAQRFLQWGLDNGVTINHKPVKLGMVAKKKKKGVFLL